MRTHYILDFAQTLTSPGGQSLEDATGEVLALGQLEAGQVRAQHQHRPQQLVCEELEAGEVQLAEAGRLPGEDLEGGLGDPLVVAEVEAAADGDVEADQLVEAAADRAEAEEVTGGEAGEDLGEEDVLGGEEVQHAHGGHTPGPHPHHISSLCNKSTITGLERTLHYPAI